MIVMGVDASLGSTGVAVIDTESYTKVTELTKIRTTVKKATPTESARLAVIYETFCNMLEQFKPDVVVVENQYIGRGPRGNPKTGMLLSRVRGVIQLACSLKGIPFFTLEPSEIKQEVTGKGNAKKELVQEGIVSRYQNEELVKKQLDKMILTGKDKTDDMADALAIAHTYSVKPDVAESA